MPPLEETLLEALIAERRLSEERALIPGLLQHDLANVLTQVSLSAEFLARATAPADREETLRQVQGGVKRMGELLHGMQFLYHTRAGVSDYARGEQNVRSGRGKIDFLRYQSERHIVETPVIAPICAWIHRDSWVDFPPINWFSDDVQCADMKRRHFISRAYVHHVGSQTCGQDAQRCYEDAEPWLLANRPEMHARFYFTGGA
jgi:hypothetical protein